MRRNTIVDSKTARKEFWKGKERVRLETAFFYQNLFTASLSVTMSVTLFNTLETMQPLYTPANVFNVSHSVSKIIHFCQQKNQVSNNTNNMSTARLLFVSALAVAATTAFLPSSTAAPTTTPLYTVDQAKLKECHTKSQINVPFYLNNHDAAVQATSSPTSSINDDGIESTIKAESIIKTECFECPEVHQFISNERSNIIKNHLSCATNDDCVMNWANTSLRGGCQYVVNKEGSTLLDAWVKKWDLWMNGPDSDSPSPSGSNQIEFHHNTCGYATPTCMIQQSECHEGQCREVRNRPSEVEYAYPVNTDGDPSDPVVITLIRV